MLHTRNTAFAWLVLLIWGIAPLSARADAISFSGLFTQDDNAHLLNFSVALISDVTLRTWSYAGGVNAVGVAIPAGGFDPSLALFNDSGTRISQNDDGGCANVTADATSGECWDAFLQVAGLAPGTYTVSITQFDNVSIGPSLLDGFSRTGQGNFTTEFGPCSQFNDLSGTDCRAGHWAVDVIGVNDLPVVPEPTTILLVGTGVAGMIMKQRRRCRGATRRTADFNGNLGTPAERQARA